MARRSRKQELGRHADAMNEVRRIIDNGEWHGEDDESFLVLIEIVIRDWRIGATDAREASREQTRRKKTFQKLMQALKEGRKNSQAPVMGCRVHKCI